jgi:hypothetical protein
MIEVARSTDAGLVAELLTHDDVWLEGGDDGTGDPEGFVPVFHESVYYLVPALDGEPMGIFMVTPSNSVTFEWHTGILKPFRGKNAILGCRLACQWMELNTPARKLITWVDVQARHVYLYAKACGFGVEGISHGSLLKSGQIHDQYLMGRLLCRLQQ